MIKPNEPHSRSYTILIAEDQKIDRDTVKYLINTFDLPLHVVEAKDGEIALNYLSNNPVDILLTDIKMPFLDGMRLASEAKKLYPKIVTVIFSAYGEFDYAQKAIELSVSRFIMKPVDPEELRSVLVNTIQYIDGEKKREISSKSILQGYQRGLELEKNLLLRKLVNGVQCDDELKSRLRVLGIDAEKDRIVMVLVDFSERFFDTHDGAFEESLRKSLQCFAAYLNLSEYQSLVFLQRLPPDDISEFLRDIGDLVVETSYQLGAKRTCLVFGIPISDPADISRVYDSIEELSNQKFFYDDTIMLFSSDTSQTKDEFVAPTDELNEILRAIEVGNFNHATEALERLFLRFQQNLETPLAFVKYVSTEIAETIFNKSGREMNETFIKHLNKIVLVKRLSDLKDQLMSLLINESTPIVYGEDRRRLAVRESIRIIDKEYMNDLGLEYIADKVYLSPSYLSSLFKSETNIGIMKYITNLRMEKAAKLLVGTNLKIADLGAKVGYTNSSYFSRIFRSHFGSSPVEFREGNIPTRGPLDMNE